LNDLVLMTAADRLRADIMRILRFSLAFIILFSIVMTALLVALQKVHRWRLKREAIAQKTVNKRVSTAKRKPTVRAKQQQYQMSVRKIKALESRIIFICVFVGSIFIVGLLVLLIMRFSLRHRSEDINRLIESGGGAVSREDTSQPNEPRVVTGNAIQVRVLLEIPVDGQSVQRQVQRIQVLPTQTGFLRVRDQPSLNGTPIGTVAPGDTFISSEVTNGWYKIPFNSGVGWVFGAYVGPIETENVN